MSSNSKVGWVVVAVVSVAAVLLIVSTVQREETFPPSDPGAQRALQAEPLPPPVTVKPTEATVPQAAGNEAKVPERRTAKAVDDAVVPVLGERIVMSLRSKKVDASCPHGLLYDVEMSHENVVPAHDQHVVDVAAIREPAAQPKGDLKIPRIVHMVNARDQVPEGMREAMQSVYDANPDFEFRYSSDTRLVDQMQQQLGSGQAGLLEQLVPTKLRAEFATWHFLHEFGGVHLHTGFVAGGTPLSQALQPGDQLVLALNPDGTISTDFIAASPKHPVIARVLEWIRSNIEMQKYGKDAEAITGTGPITDAFRDVLKEAPKVGYSKDGVRVIAIDRNPKCLIGKVLDGEKLLFWSRYPSYGTETRWYRIKSDDAAAAWSKRHVFGSHDCPGGLTLGQENDQINQAPDRNQILVDMAPFHPATKVAGPKQKIPRHIMQTNKADRIPKDLKKAMLSLINMNPEYDHYYYSDARIRDFIKQHFDQKTLDAFDAVIPGAYKSDLFRYCFLYVKGGIFLDGDVVAARPIEELIRSDDEFLSAEDCGIGWVHNAFMASIPGHPIVKKALDMAVDRITRRDYGENPLAITGPILLRDAFRAATGQEHIKVGEYGNHVRLLNYSRQAHCMTGRIEEHGRVVLWMRYDTYKSEGRWYMKGKATYGDLWHARHVFREEWSSPPTGGNSSSAPQ